MSHAHVEDEKSVANMDEGSETDVEPGQASDHSEAASFLKAFNAGQETCDELGSEKIHRARKGQNKILSILYAIAPWALSLVLFVALLSERFKSKYLCNGDVKAQYTLAQDHIEYRTELMYDGVDNRNPASEYQGWPNDDKDKLWDQFDGEIHLLISLCVECCRDLY